MIKVVLFDADGVLIIGEKFADHLQRELKISPETTEPFFKRCFKECLIGKADLKVEIAPYLPQWGWNKSVDEFLELWFGVEHHLNHILLGYVKSLREQGVKCYIATNQEKYRSQYIQDYMKLKSLFDGVFASNEMGVCKPDEMFFNKVTNQLKANCDEVLFWDDTQANIDSANKLGIHGESYTNNNDFRKTMNGNYRISL